LSQNTFAHHILDALSAHIALLDPNGRIELLNETWRRFATANVLQADSFAVGLNYLELCEQAQGECADDAARMAKGIRAVLNSESDLFEFVYPSHSPTEKRWFRAIVTPVHLAGHRYALIAHISVVKGALAEATLREIELKRRTLIKELNRQQERLAVAQAVAKIGNWETDLSTYRVFWSAETYRIFEVDPEAFTPTHESFLQLVHPDDRARVDDAFKKSIAAKGTRSVDHRIVLSGDRIKYLSEIWQVIFDEDGRPATAVGTCQDITERQLTNERLRESEARLERAQAVAGVGSWEIDVDREHLVLSKQMYHIRGLPPSDKPLPVGDFAHVVPSDREKASAWLRGLQAGQDVGKLEMSLRRPDGETRIVVNEAKPVFDETGRVTKITGTLRDVTESRTAEQELRQSKLHLALAQRVASIGSAAIDFRTGKWDWSDETYRIYGVKRSEFTPSAEALGTLLHPDDRDELLSKPALALKGITPPPIEYRIRRPDGAERILRREATLVSDESGEITGIVGTVQDVTDMRAAEREKDFLQAQLRQAQRLETVGQLTGGIAHDFNNLLTVILGNAEAFGTHIPKSSPLHELAEITRMAAEHGAALVRQLQAFSRQQPLDPRSIDVNGLVSGMDRLLRRALGEDVLIETSCAPNLWRALVDAPLLESALLNLAVNARDAMPQGGRLAIKTQNIQLDFAPAASTLQNGAENAQIVAGQYVMVAVSDTGTGMDEATQLKAFDPFFTTKAVGKGSGLGLSMVYGFVTQSKGYVRIESEPGQGTTVKIYLPRAAETEFQSRVDPEEVYPPQGHERVLVVEDDGLVRSQVMSQLKTLGYQVTEAVDGVEALKILATNKRFDLLFTDVVMPGGINGWELAHEARNLIPGLRVLFTSGYAENAITHQARVDPGVDFLNKPYRRLELASKLRNILDA
jgi:PAS domain S-box-containing protein